MRLPIRFMGLSLIWLGICVHVNADPTEWERVDVGLQEHLFTAVAIHPTLPAHILAATPRTLYESHDSGQQWQQRFRVAEGVTVTDIDISADTPPVMLVATDRGLYGSFDEGATWSLLFRGANAEASHCTYVAFHPSQPTAVLLGTRGGLFISVNRGRQWTPVSVPKAARDVIHFAFDPTNPDHVHLISAEGFFSGDLKRAVWEQRLRLTRAERPEIKDPSETTKDANEPETPPHRFNGVALNPRHPSILYLATSRGVTMSRNGGTTWQPLTSIGLASPTVLRVLLQTHSPLVLYAATTKGVVRYDPRRAQWVTMTHGLSATQVNDLAATYGQLWAATSQGLFHYAIPPETLEESQPPSAQEILADFGYEPTIAQVREAAIRYAEVHPDKIRQWRRQAAWRAVLPTVDLGMNHHRSNNKTVDQGTFPKFQIIPTEDRDAKADFSLKWDLANLIWNSDQTSIDARSRFMVELRNDIVDQVTRAYFERRRLQTTLLVEPPSDSRAALEQQLRLDELTALIDGLTGGYFSQSTTITHN